MASYGIPGGGPAWTGFSGVLANTPSSADSPILFGGAGIAQFNGLTQEDNRIANSLNKKANWAIRQLFISMIGAAPGALASHQYRRVRAQSASGLPPGSNIGGLVPIDVVDYINRLNTVQDDNNLSALVMRTHGPAVYPNDASTNGGGSKSGVGGKRYI